MAILFLDFFGSDPSKMDQTCKFGEQTSRILEFKPKGLDFQLSIKPFKHNSTQPFLFCFDKHFWQHYFFVLKRKPQETRKTLNFFKTNS